MLDLRIHLGVSPSYEKVSLNSTIELFVKVCSISFVAEFFPLDFYEKWIIWFQNSHVATPCIVNIITSEGQSIVEW